MRAVDQFRRNRRRRELLRKRRRRMPKWPFAVLGVLLLLGLGAGVGAAGYTVQRYNDYTKGLTNPAEKVQQDQGPAILYDRDGNELFEYEDAPCPEGGGSTTMDWDEAASSLPGESPGWRGHD